MAPLLDLVGNTKTATLADAFAAGESVLRQHYRSEYLYKNDLVSRIVFGRHSPRTASALLEVPMGNSCADLMVLNGTTTIYEVKTDLDQLDRLKTQLPAYSTRVEYVNVAIGEKRASDAFSGLPPNVGLIVVRKNGSMTTIREATSGIEKVNSDHIYQMLRHGEALELLNRVNGYTLDVPAGHAWKRMRALISELDPEVVHRHAVEVLKGRSRGATGIVADPSFPTVLRALAYGASLNPTRTARTLHRLAAPAAESCHS